MLAKERFLSISFLEHIKRFASYAVIALIFYIFGQFIWYEAQNDIAKRWCQVGKFNSGHVEKGFIVCEGWLLFPLDPPQEKEQT